MVAKEKLMEEALRAVQDAGKPPSGFDGLPSGLEELDRVLCGFDKSDLIVVGARPAMGNSSFMLSLVINLAEQDIPVLFYSIEKSKTCLMRHILSNVSAIDRDKISSGKWDKQEWEKMCETTDAISHYPIYIDDEPLWVIEDFCDRVKQDVEATKAKVIFIDYLQLISSCLPSQNRCEEVARCTCELKRLARELNLPVVVALQLKRVVGKRLFEFSCERYFQTDDLCDEGFPKKTICWWKGFPKWMNCAIAKSFLPSVKKRMLFCCFIVRSTTCAVVKMRTGMTSVVLQRCILSKTTWGDRLW